MAKPTVSLQQWLQDWLPSIHQDALLSGITQDSRDVTVGTAFLAYPGVQGDGRAYISEALLKGAAAVIYEASDDLSLPQTSVPVIPFPDLSQHVAELASSFYADPSHDMSVIGITGTNGKTSCSQFIAEALSFQGIRCGVLGTIGNGFLPKLEKATHTTLDAVSLQRTFASLKEEGAEAVAMEVSSHALHQGRVKSVQFDIAVLTQLSRDHLDYHHDMASYAKAKSLLFEQPGLQYAVLNRDDAFGRQLAEAHRDHLKLFMYSAEGDVDPDLPCVVATSIEARCDGFLVTLQTPWGTGQFKTSLLGRFNISNLLAVLTVLGILGVALSDALAYVSQLKEPPGRMQRLGGGQQPTVVVDYAHTPDALEKALISLREHCQGKLWCVFGCGGDRDAGKRPEMAAVAEAHADHVVVTQDNPRNEAPDSIINDILKGFKQLERVEVQHDRGLAIQQAVQAARAQDMVLIAGKGHETVQIIRATAEPFDDCQEVMRILKGGVCS